MKIKNYGYNDVNLEDLFFSVTAEELNVMVTHNGYFTLVNTETDIENWRIHTDIDLNDLLSLFNSNLDSVEVKIFMAVNNAYITLRKSSRYGHLSNYQTIGIFNGILLNFELAASKEYNSIQIKLSTTSQL